MASETQSFPPSAARRLIGLVRRKSIRSAAIRELRAMPSYRLSDLGISRAQIPEFVDALLHRHSPARESVAPSEVRASFIETMLGPWADGVTGRPA